MAVIRDISLEAARGVDREREFNLQTHCVSGLMLDLLPALKTERTRKLVVEATPLEKQPGALELVGEIGVVGCAFDFARFWRSQPAVQKQLIAECLHDGLRRAADVFRWDSAVVDGALETASETGFLRERRWRKPIKSPDRTATGEVWYRHESDRFDVELRILDSGGGVVASGCVTTTRPHEAFLLDVLGKASWVGTNEFELESRDGERRWSITRLRERN